MLDTLVASPDTVDCICSLLLLPSPLSLYFNRILAHILLRLGLHSKDLSLHVIKMVLRNGVSESYKCTLNRDILILLSWRNTSILL